MVGKNKVLMVACMPEMPFTMKSTFNVATDSKEFTTKPNPTFDWRMCKVEYMTIGDNDEDLTRIGSPSPVAIYKSFRRPPYSMRLPVKSSNKDR